MLMLVLARVGGIGWMLMGEWRIGDGGWVFVLELSVSMWVFIVDGWCSFQLGTEGAIARALVLVMSFCVTTLMMGWFWSWSFMVVMICVRLMCVASH